MMTIRIEFDGGTSCNVPRLGYGNGYGSYKIGDESVSTVHFGEAMSANAAEIRTLVHALETLRQRGCVDSTLVIVGDSRIALKWAERCFVMRGRVKLTGKTSEKFKEAIHMLNEALDGFANVGTQWQPRMKSVATFGH